MEDDVATLLPIGVTWSEKKLAGNGERCSSCDPVSFLHI
jgi:hypothetical protein